MVAPTNIVCGCIFNSRTTNQFAGCQHPLGYGTTYGTRLYVIRKWLTEEKLFNKHPGWYMTSIIKCYAGFCIVNTIFDCCD